MRRHPRRPFAEDADESRPVAKEEDTGAEVAPIIKLDAVSVSTGEENEDALIDLKAKLYRFDKEGNQLKERGVGQVKLLKHKETEKVQLVMRQSKTLKICANHTVVPSISLQEHQGSDKTVENAQAFKKAFEDAQKAKKGYGDAETEEVVEESQFSIQPTKLIMEEIDSGGLTSEVYIFLRGSRMLPISRKQEEVEESIQMHDGERGAGETHDRIEGLWSLLLAESDANMYYAADPGCKHSHTATHMCVMLDQRATTGRKYSLLCCALHAPHDATLAIVPLSRCLENVEIYIRVKVSQGKAKVEEEEASLPKGKGKGKGKGKEKKQEEVDAMPIKRARQEETTDSEADTRRKTKESAESSKNKNTKPRQKLTIQDFALGESSQPYDLVDDVSMQGPKISWPQLLYLSQGKMKLETSVDEFSSFIYSTTIEEESTTSNGSDSSGEVVMGLILTEPNKVDPPDIPTVEESKLAKMLARDLIEEEKQTYLTMLEYFPRLFIEGYDQITGVTVVQHHINLKGVNPLCNGFDAWV
ncbi:hypothetical protein L7F22_066691 [Adiantum nelumboides]|nr:hypothetical protein [Adiantum nelumboides]